MTSAFAAAFLLAIAAALLAWIRAIALDRARAQQPPEDPPSHVRILP